MSLAGLPEQAVRADGMTGVVIFAIVYAIVTIMGKLKQAPRGGADSEPQEPKRPRPRPNQQARRPPPPQRTESPGRPAGGTQGEALKLEELFRVLTGGPGAPGSGPMGRRSAPPAELAEDVEERASLEVEERVLNLEATPVARASRRDVDHDDEAEGVVQARIRAAEMRNRPLNLADHAAFDARIRQEPADNTRTAAPLRRSLRDAIVWREILGPPVSLRDSSDQNW